ncbi:hypothetical protein [Peribacillus faecalis]|uniref:hypothetical protein n=1 Tax=Peribacillus faecalis TaxID=2772559 RepID=UPI0038B40563
MNDEGSENVLSFPKSNVLKFLLADGSWVCIRPSGTEPKIKFYIGVSGESDIQSQGKLEKIKNLWMGFLEGFIK